MVISTLDLIFEYLNALSTKFLSAITIFVSSTRILPLSMLFFIFIKLLLLGNKLTRLSNSSVIVISFKSKFLYGMDCLYFYVLEAFQLRVAFLLGEIEVRGLHLAKALVFD